MDTTPSTAQSQEENSQSREKLPTDPSLDPSWEKWRNEQVQTISNILSNVFRVEDEVRQRQAPSRLLRNPARQSGGNEVEICEKLNAIREQISEYEKVLQLSLKRIDNALQEIQPHEPEAPPEKPAPIKPITKFESFKNWVKNFIRIRS
jgi:hypothetical protein